MPEKQFKIVAAVVLCVMAFVCRELLQAADGEREALEQKLSEAYKGKTLMLRGNYCGRSLKFDDQGKLRKSGPSGDWTICRDIVVDKVSLEKSHLTISGRRIFWMFDDHATKFRDVTEMADKNRKDFSELVQKQEVSVEVVFPSDNDQQHIESLRNKVFWPADADPRETASPEWQCFLTPDGQKDKNCLSDKTKEPESPPGAGDPERMGGKVKPPKMRHTPDPSYSDEARRWRIRGVMGANVVVGSDGRPASVMIKRPLGMGLDARAAEMIRTWKFDPATRDGVPVAVLVSIEVKFDLY